MATSISVPFATACTKIMEIVQKKSGPQFGTITYLITCDAQVDHIDPHYEKETRFVRGRYFPYVPMLKINVQ